MPDCGRLIVNADDWGRDRETTDRTVECIGCAGVTSVSAMVFMADSERAAAIAREKGIDAGLHLNLTTPFSAKVPPGLPERQGRLARYLESSPLARGIFHPGLARAFEYVVQVERDEFCRLYGREAERFDGHHHMHLAANVLLGNLLPQGALVRRHYSYERGEKAVRNFVFRQLSRLLLARGAWRVVDYFFSLPPLEPRSRFEAILCLARHSVVEVETHPVNPEEYRYLTAAVAVR